MIPIEFLKNNLFIQNFAATLFSNISPFLENIVAKYLANKKAFDYGYRGRAFMVYGI